MSVAHEPHRHAPPVARDVGGGTTAGLLTAAAVLPLALTGLAMGVVYIPYAHYGVQLLKIGATVATLVWLYRTFTVLKGRAKYSAGFAVASWFIPLANFFLPALVLKDAWRTTRGSGSAIALLWMPAWWLLTALNVLDGVGLTASSSGLEGTTIWLDKLDGTSFGPFEWLPIQAYTYGYTALAMLTNLAAYGLLALIVSQVSQSLKREQGVV